MAEHECSEVDAHIQTQINQPKKKSKKSQGGDEDSWEKKYVRGFLLSFSRGENMKGSVDATKRGDFTETKSQEVTFENESK